MTVVGKGIDRVDGRKKVTGQATYAAEVAVANVAHAVLVGGAAVGKITKIDVAGAKAAPGVLAVITHENAPRLAKPNPEGERQLQLLQDGEVRYVDQPVAVVVADTLERAREAAALVAVEIAAATPASDLAAARGAAFTPKQAGPAKDVDSARGDAAAALAGAAVKVEATYTTPNETHNPMEMHATTAVWHGDDALTVYDSTQGIFGVRTRLATVFGLKKENVRVISHFVGGGFGSKGSAWSHVPIAAMAAKVVGRGVKLMVMRTQMFALVGYRPRTIQEVALGAKRDGTLVAMRHDVFSETSRFDLFAEPAALQTRMLYACPNVATSHRVARLDVSTPTFTRAPGESTGTFALESAIDELAAALAIDPLALRIQNHAATDEHERKPFSSKSLLECYRRGAAAFGWAKRSAKPRSMRDGAVLVGMGMASATYPARQLPASASAKLLRDGVILVQAGTQDIGTGTYTIMTQIAADALGVPVEQVRFELGDTALPETPLSAGSFTASSTGSAVKVTCAALRDKLARLAGKRAGDALDYAALAKAHGEVMVEQQTKPTPEREKYSTHAFGAVFVEVGVDEELGIVRLRRIAGAYAAGRILNAKTARSQLLGGIVWGIGMALTEHAARDPRTARVVTRDLADYHVPVNADVPPIDVIMVDEADAIVNEVGAKGIGEIGTTGVAAAVANAVYHATGKRVRDLPITLDKLIGAERRA